jgi:hypothetical protein
MKAIAPIGAAAVLLAGACAAPHAPGPTVQASTPATAMPRPPRSDPPPPPPTHAAFMTSWLAHVCWKGPAPADAGYVEAGLESGWLRSDVGPPCRVATRAHANALEAIDAALVEVASARGLRPVEGSAPGARRMVGGAGESLAWIYATGSVAESWLSIEWTEGTR